MDLIILGLTFSHFEKESIGCIQFNGKIINILPFKICINLQAQVFNTVSRTLSFIIFLKSPLKFFCLELKITISE